MEQHRLKWVSRIRSYNISWTRLIQNCRKCQTDYNFLQRTNSSTLRVASGIASAVDGIVIKLDLFVEVHA